MDKKVWIALILSMAVLFFYPYFIQQFYPASEAQRTAEQAAPADGQQAAQPAPPAPEAPAAPPAKEVLTTVDTPLFSSVLSSHGGSITSFELKKYSEGLDNGRTVNASEKVGKRNSFSTLMEINGTTEQISFSPSAEAVAIGESEQAKLVYTGTSSTGLVIEKNYLFSSDSYLIETGLKFRNPTDRAVSVRAETVLSADATGKDDTGYHQGPVTRTADKLIRQDEGDPAATGTGGLKWIGLEDKYFLSALLPQAEKQVSWSAEAPSPGQARAALQLPLSLAPGETASFSYGSFIGPKEYDRLVKQGMGLEESIEFGWFDWMAKPALVVLNFFNRFLGNYGLSIIALTVVIKVLFYPLTKKSLNSMREMQKMQPQLAALKERYKNDKEKMNKELMELYKRNKINPLGGCLPMLLQIPVFIALYEVLYVAIELRHAPFFFWIQDLSAKDPYYITPILMGATMFLQQKMTPTAMDPTQQKIMMFLPLIFTFMFLTFPSGLVLYWLVNNVLTIGQHYFIYKTPAKARAKA